MTNCKSVQENLLNNAESEIVAVSCKQFTFYVVFFKCKN